jgi:hypothetical protein
MFLPLTPGLKIHCFEDAGGIIEGHLPLKLLSFTQNAKEAARMKWFTSNFCPKTSSFQQNSDRKRPSFPIILDRAKPQPGAHTSGWRVPGKRRKAGVSPAGNRERIAVDLPTFNGKWIWVKTLYPW